ncbi:MAG: helix-turn-helix domain-containing protein, partial [Deltaproteobacteria bacterium]
RLADADAQIERLLLQDALARLVQFLTRAAEHRGQPDGSGVRVQMSIADLPAELGLSPPQVKEAMRKVSRAGLATFQVDGIALPDVSRLRELQQLLQEDDGRRITASPSSGGGAPQRAGS